MKSLSISTYRSTIEIISISLEDIINKNLSYRLSVSKFATIFDTSFDTPPHELLNSKLFGCDIGGKTLKWIDSFLCYRQQRVVVNGAKSDWAPLLSGVPQGTVLGPLMFSLCINDISTNIDSEIRLFADDCVCYREVKDTEDTLKLQKDIDQLGCWARKWGMRFQPVKMQYDANTKGNGSERSMLHILWRERSSKMSKTSSISGSPLQMICDGIHIYSQQCLH